jgi:predicted HAD superfamily Cof-like phosphohydrolase
MFMLMDNVLAFHKKMGQPIGDPRDPDVTIEVDFRIALIQEEFNELKLALSGYKKNKANPENGPIPFESKAEQIAAVADALADLSYVTAGSAVAWGIDLGSVVAEVHYSNMSKTPNMHGKAIKGEGFHEAQVADVLADVAREFTINAEDDIGDEEKHAWPTPRKYRTQGEIQAETAQVIAETIEMPTARLRFDKADRDRLPHD